MDFAIVSIPAAAVLTAAYVFDLFRKRSPSKARGVALFLPLAAGAGLLVAAYLLLLTLGTSPTRPPEVAPAQQLVVRDLYKIPQEAIDTDVNYVESAYSVGSTVDIEVFKEIHRNLLTSVEGNRAATSMAKDMAVILNLTNHPEQADFSFHVKTAVDRVYFDGKTYSEEIQFELQEAKNSDERTPVFRCKFGLGVTPRSLQEAYNLFDIEVASSAASGARKIEPGEFTLKPFSTSRSESDSFIVEIRDPLSYIGGIDEGLLTVKISEIEQHVLFSHFWFETQRFRRGVGRVSAQVHLKKKAEDLPQAYTLDIRTGGRHPLSVTEKAPQSSDDWWKYSVEIRDRIQPLIVEFDQG